MHRFPGPRFRAFIAPLALLVTLVSTDTLAQEVTFSIIDGRKITGRVLSATLNTLNVHQTDGGYSVLPRQEIVGVVMDVEGGAVMGSFINWQEGRFTLRVDDRVVTIRDGVIEGEPSEIVQPASRDAASVPLEAPEALAAPEALEIPKPLEIEVIEPEVGEEDVLPPSEPIEQPTM